MMNISVATAYVKQTWSRSHIILTIFLPHSLFSKTELQYTSITRTQSMDHGASSSQRKRYEFITVSHKLSIWFHGAGYSLKSELYATQLVKECYACMQPVLTSLCSQKSTIRPYPVPIQSNPHLQFLFS